jgi:hypothetical protein
MLGLGRKCKRFLIDWWGLWLKRWLSGELGLTAQGEIFISLFVNRQWTHQTHILQKKQASTTAMQALSLKCNFARPKTKRYAIFN